MGKNQYSKSEEKGTKIWQKNSAKNQPQNSPKIRWNSRTMEWLKIPIKKQREFRENIIAVNVDFIQYACYQISEPLKNLYEIIGFTGEIDDDNSNIEHNHNYNLSLTRNKTEKGFAYNIFFHSPGFAPLRIINIEIYSDDKVKMLKAEGKIVFYGAYFVFREIIAEEAPEILRFANTIEIWSLIRISDNNKPLYKRTRVDIAIDVWVPITNNKWLTHYIKPHPNSKQVPRPYNYDGITESFQSIGYIPRLTQGIGIRVYNKVLDMINKKKQSWHPTYGTAEHPIVTRLELVFSWDFAQEDIKSLIKYTKFRILWDDSIKLKRKIRPKSQYSALSAHEYFKRYAKNHGKSLREVLDDVTAVEIAAEQREMNELMQRYES